MRACGFADRRERDPPQHLPQPLARLSGQPQRHVHDLDDRLAVGVHQRVGDHKRLRPVATLLDRHLVSDLARRRRNLAPALQPAGNSRHRLPGDGAVLPDPANADKKDPQCVQTALVHQRAGHDLVVDEVARQEPCVRRDVVLGADQAARRSGPRWVEVS